MATKPFASRSTRFEKYGLHWNYGVSPLKMEMDMIAHGGSIKKRDGSTAGNGLFFHMKRFQEILWPELKWNRWRDEMLRCFLDYRYVGVAGCAASGKSDSFGCNVLADWYVFSDCTSVLISSTDLKTLELRVWGMIKKYHRAAKELHPWLPGHLIEGKQMIVLSQKEEAADGRDFKNGLIGVACRRGNQFVGLGPLVGIHNKRVRMLADELSLMPRALLDATSNLSKCEDFKIIGLGNPSETTNAHGVLCEPAVELGGWEGGIDQSPKTKTWKTKFPDGICLQTPGSDSPNYDVPEDQEPSYPFLMTRQQMTEDAKIWGLEDWHYTMMNDARMPRGQGSRRIITRQMCEKFGATLEPFWRDTNITKIAFLDAAYRGVGGDRCVFGELQFGRESESTGDMGVQLVSNLISQGKNYPQGRLIVALVDLVTIPITAVIGGESAEDQIVKFVKEKCEARAIPPANFYFDSGMRTSLVTAFSRLWSTDINSVDCGSKPSEGIVSSEIRVSCREYYSKFITELWFSVRLAIESRQFRGLNKDAMWEFCAREWKTVSGNKIEVESKEEMRQKTGRSPDCFVAGTTITTLAGEKPIENIAKGDLVQTPFGPSSVIAIHCSATCELTTVQFNDGSKLTGKGKHRIFTWTRGWVKLSELRLTDRIETDKTLFVWHLANILFTKAGNTGFKALADIIRMGTIGEVGVRDFYIESSGLSTRAVFLKGCASIIRMVIGVTTKSKTWNLCRLKIMPGITCLKDWISHSSVSKTGKICPKQSSLPSSGMDQKRVESGIVNMQKTSAKIENQNAIAASSVGKSFLPEPFTKLLNSVRSDAITKTFGSGISLLESAWNVVQISWQTSMKKRPVVPIAVPLSVAGKSVKVYNLTLEEHNAYYANGVLVQNCADAISIGLYGAIQRGFRIAKLSEESEESRGPDWRRKFKERAANFWRNGELTHTA